jgi:hypothetical protein
MVMGAWLPELDRRVGAYRRAGDGIAWATAKAIRGMWRARRRYGRA